MRIATIVFARMDSRRLPGKALARIAGRPLLGHVLARVRRARFPALVATSDRALDDPIAALAEGEGVACFRGDAEDVAARALACMERHRFNAIIRISGDSPFIDPALIEAVAGLFMSNSSVEIATNVHPRSFPPGQSVEVIARGALARVIAETRAAADREHVTRYVYAHPGRFRVVNYAAPAADYAGLGLAVDTPEDLRRAEWMIGAGAGEAASLADIVAIARRYAAEHSAQ
ncbi:MAG TPA: NTP transferase domain-containing protein [Alphaproteobacteria bacterium]|jgi:spore coat polysaccharide biosynthesis protein SpsF (cytidylyltransferase family)